jgi:hypothetical protein
MNERIKDERRKLTVMDRDCQDEEQQDKNGKRDKRQKHRCNECFIALSSS